MYTFISTSMVISLCIGSFGRLTFFTDSYNFFIFRSNWVQFSKSISFSVPVSERLLTDVEVYAINKYWAYERVSISTVGGYAERMLQSEKVYHSKAYKRAGNSCSSLVQFTKENETSSEDDYCYGEI